MPASTSACIASDFPAHRATRPWLRTHSSIPPPMPTGRNHQPPPRPNPQDLSDDDMRSDRSEPALLRMIALLVPRIRALLRRITDPDDTTSLDEVQQRLTPPSDHPDHYGIDAWTLTSVQAVQRRIGPAGAPSASSSSCGWRRSSSPTLGRRPGPGGRGRRRPSSEATGPSPSSCRHRGAGRRARSSRTVHGTGTAVSARAAVCSRNCFSCVARRYWAVRCRAVSAAFVAAATASAPFGFARNQRRFCSVPYARRASASASSVWPSIARAHRRYSGAACCTA